MENSTFYQLALTRIKGIGPIHTKNLIAHFGDAQSVFRAGRTALKGTGLNRSLIDSILGFSDGASIQQELKHLAYIGARPIFFTDPDYPQRLLTIPKAPALFFYQGVADLNTAKIIAIAGTRTPSPYGIQMTTQLVRSLACPDLIILSGLAYGIDAVAHATAIRSHIPTIGVLGHGFDHMYPAHHRGLSNAMRRQGGLLTSFFHEQKADRYTFPLRNQVVAALCDALIIIESSTKGGSLTTADAATQFQKKIFALPGRVTDNKSAGCLQLLHEQRALPLISADQLKAAIGWDCPAGHSSHQPSLPFKDTQRSSLFQAMAGSSTTPQRSRPDISCQILEDKLINLLKERQPLSFEELIHLSLQPIPSLSLALLRLEIDGAIRTLPGRRYRLAG